jgi:hypothetical protein
MGVLSAVPRHKGDDQRDDQGKQDDCTCGETD